MLMLQAGFYKAAAGRVSVLVNAAPVIHDVDSWVNTGLCPHLYYVSTVLSHQDQSLIVPDPTQRETDDLPFLS